MNTSPALGALTQMVVNMFFIVIQRLLAKRLHVRHLLTLRVIRVIVSIAGH